MLKLLLASAIFFLACKSYANDWIPSDSARHIIAERAQEVLAILAKKEVGKLTPFIHPESGLGFSPYGFISKASRKFKIEELTSLWKNKQKFFWGLYNGSGKPIRRTFQEYFNRFVCDRDYSSSLIAYNVVQRTDMFVNIFEMYPRSIIVDHLFLTTPEFEEMDWRALRLVFTEYHGEWYLVHIVHDEWTI
jgi:hypothetical protein